MEGLLQIHGFFQCLSLTSYIHPYHTYTYKSLLGISPNRPISYLRKTILVFGSPEVWYIPDAWFLIAHWISGLTKNPGYLKTDGFLVPTIKRVHPIQSETISCWAFSRWSLPSHRTSGCVWKSGIISTEHVRRIFGPYRKSGALHPVLNELIFSTYRMDGASRDTGCPASITRPTSLCLSHFIMLSSAGTLKPPNVQWFHRTSSACFPPDVWHSGTLIAPMATTC